MRARAIGGLNLVVRRRRRNAEHGVGIGLAGGLRVAGPSGSRPALRAPDASTKQRLFWSLRPEHPVPGIAAGGLDVPPDRVHALSKTHTRLAKLPSGVHYQLANLGYALADHRVRPVLRPGAAPPTSFPFPGGLG
jgi:hypothetical protein